MAEKKKLALKKKKSKKQTYLKPIRVETAEHMNREIRELLNDKMK
ncbi:MAG: hypothetical protein K940chlam3_01472 [Chlamydiae bacterium]|nr:hypothetical protein [Chlamydiota bacterium]